MTTPLAPEESELLERVPAALRSGRELLDWWRHTDAAGSYARTYPETYVFNRPEDRSFGFFDRAPLSSGTIAVNGNVQEMFYDEPKTARGGGESVEQAAEWMAEQVREFVLHYFLRVSDFRQPQRTPEPHAPTPPGLGLLSQCIPDPAQRQGFGFQQLYYRGGPTHATPGLWHRFRETRRDAIVDLRTLGPGGTSTSDANTSDSDLDLLVLRNPIYDFQFKLQPFGPQGPSLSLPLSEFNYLALSRDFVVDEHHPEPGILGRYGFGYAFVRKPEPSALGYGPGELEPAFELLVWTVHASGQVTVRATFVAERPRAMLRLAADPFAWGFQFANTFGPPSVKRFLQPWKRFYHSLPGSGLRFDPVFPALRLLDVATLGQASKRFCISTEQLEKEFLFLHFQQHYQTILGSLQTWRQIPDWLDAASLPAFVLDGRTV